MFEKEAEEYVRKIWYDVINWDGAEPEERFYNEIKLKQAYQQGAEFGYNKCDEQLTKAKKLITRFIMGNVYFYGKETDLVEKAKQFLRELEE